MISGRIRPMDGQPVTSPQANQSKRKKPQNLLEVLMKNVKLPLKQYILLHSGWLGDKSWKRSVYQARKVFKQANWFLNKTLL